VLCDIIMPEKDGYEVCEQIKSSPSWSHLPVLLLTGAFEPFDQERATRAGYDGSLAKPFEPETLIAKVKDLLARAPRPGPARPATTDTATAVPVPSFLPPPTSRPAPPAPATAAVAAEGAAPLTAGFIPEEPFSGLDDAFASDARAVTMPPLPAAEPERLAEISEEESAALAPPATFEEPADDTVSTVMFRASDLPWGAPPAAAPAAAPPMAEPAEEPLFVADPPALGEADAELVEEPPVFEAVLEEDLEFGGTEYPAEAPPEPQTFDDTSAEPFGEVTATAEAQEEEDIFAPELTARSPVAGVGEGASGAFAALVRDQVPVPDGASDTNTFSEPLRVPAPSEPPPAVPGGEAVQHESEPAHASSGLAAEAVVEPEPELEEIGEQSFPEAPLEEPTAVEDALPAAEAAETFESFEPAPDAEELLEAEPVTAAEAEAQPAPAQEALPQDRASFEEAWPEPSPTDEPLPADAPLPAERPLPTAVREPEPSHASFEPEPPRSLFEPAPAPAESPVAAPPLVAVAAAPVLPAVADVPEESFGDVAETLAESQPQPHASEAATLAVPVEMVEKIAQRVVAQISEKTVREIAWEVIPDLAEALIKQEIEKLKAELAKL
jgi:hypothetical protein